MDVEVLLEKLEDAKEIELHNVDVTVDNLELVG